ncbi:MAG: hypothetical protein ACRCY9_09025 [Phycicoccus sp.]
MLDVLMACVTLAGTYAVDQPAPERPDSAVSADGEVATAPVATATEPEASTTEPEPTATEPAEKKLIELSWSAPDAATFREKVSEVEKLGLFSGTHLQLSTLDNSRVFGAAVPEANFTAEREELQAAKPETMVDNFIRVNSATDENWDWFDDDVWAGGLSNVRNVARTAAAGPIRGITLDPEAYGKSPWLYSEQVGAGSHTFEEYEAKVRARGAEFARAVVAEDPDLQIYSLGLYTWVKDVYHSYSTEAEQRDALREHGYGLLPAFINGLLEGAGPETMITDGNEMSYYATTADHFSMVKPLLDDSATSALLDPALRARYDEAYRVDHAVYVDLMLDLFDEKQNPGYYGARPPHFMSEADRMRLLEHNTYHALKNSYQYTWIYSEDIANDRNFDYGWGTTDVPDGVVETLKRAKSKVNAGEPLGFDMTAQIDGAKKACEEAVGAEYPWNCQ